MNEISTLYADDSLLAVNKPAGVLTITGGYGHSQPCLKDRLEDQYGRLWTVHRLDRNTSGVVLFARSATSHKFLNQQFEARKVTKTYHLLACGDLPSDELLVDDPLLVDGDRSHHTVIDNSHGKPASTLFRKIASYGSNVHLLAAFPHSGYTHQIRAHLSFHGCWLLNDPLYAPWPAQSSDSPVSKPFIPAWMNDIASRMPIKRLALHAESLKLIHPLTSRSLIVEAPYFQDFQSSINNLENPDFFSDL